VFINTKNVPHVFTFEGYTRICFVGGSEAFVDVTAECDVVASQIGASSV